jgi:hypothetical protein
MITAPELCKPVRTPVKLNERMNMDKAISDGLVFMHSALVLGMHGEEH